jgi:acyl-coenzyme A thioesterase PaaI-like protein
MTRVIHREAERIATSFVRAGAEAAFRVSLSSITADHAAVAVETGPWLRDRDAGVSRGALGVALDDVSGAMVAASRPHGRWPVSISMRLDFVSDPPLDRSLLTATGHLVAVDGSSGLARGEIWGGDGVPIALVTHQLQFITFDAAPASSDRANPLSDDATGLWDLLELSTPEPRTLVMPPSASASNGMGNVHGGVLAYGSECAAMSAINAEGRFRTACLDIVYARPCDARRTTIFRSEVVHLGRTLAVVRVVAANDIGKPGAVSTVTLRT